ncbi:MAG: gamma-glutamyltransferase [Proteobacteria bacterium]|nr:gamma-glutamyltransferase [Pseudomonadota bacterium]MBI3505764.1 gamma-glutamyltransferase [Pseudomonadota bacterium]
MIKSQMVQSRTEVVAENGVVTGGHPLEAEAGIAMLKAGGNAIDAVVAAAFTGFVVEPSSCGLGGYGHLSVFLAERGEFLTFDHYVRAPAAARPDMFAIDRAKPLKYYGFPYTHGMKAEHGHLAPAVPGAVAGLCAAHEMLGRLPLAKVLGPAIEAADAGVPMTWNLLLIIADKLAEIRSLPHLAAWLLRDGKPPKIAGQLGGGDRLDCRDLARTLKTIAAEGAKGFHTGAIAEAIERECRAHGGILSAADLASYRVRILREKPQRYRGNPYITAFDQVGYEALNILDQFDLAGLGRDSAAFRHLMAEALAHAYVDSMTHYGDPEHTRSPVNGLASQAFAKDRAAVLSLDAARPRPVAAADPWPYEDGSQRPDSLAPGPAMAKLAGTSQMAAADRDGNLVSLITSLTSGFGSMVLVPETGVLLNNSMQNFDPRPDRANSIEPGKMPIFAVPTLVMAEDGQARFAACGSGGYRITTAVLHSLVHVLDYRMGVQAAIDAPRVHCQGGETYVDGRIPDQVRERLAAMGHKVVVQHDDPGLNAFGRVNAIAIDPKTRRMHAGTGPAWGTAAAGY